jgi:hypothetical protein
MAPRQPERALLGAALATAAGVAGYYSYAAIKRRWPAYQAQRRLLKEVRKGRGALSLSRQTAFCLSRPSSFRPPLVSSSPSFMPAPLAVVPLVARAASERSKRAAP